MSRSIEERNSSVGHPSSGDPTPAGVEVREGRAASVGGLDIVRVLPTKGRRTVGPWCFVDLMLPQDGDDPDPMEVGPHPHIGLSTVTWLFEGEAVHSDSLGTEQLIRPGQLNLMTAGHGIAHAELAAMPGIKGVQMWIAQPERTRHGPSWFEHHGDLPSWDGGVGKATVFVGELAGVASPATLDSPAVGAELMLGAGLVEVPTVPSFEHCVVPLDRSVLVNGAVVEPGWIGIVASGSESLRIDVGSTGGRIMLLGGEPLGEPIQMWWNFVARTRDELTLAWHAWQEHDTDRFGPVPSTLDRIDAPPPPWVGRA